MTVREFIEKIEEVKSVIGLDFESEVVVARVVCCRCETDEFYKLEDVELWMKAKAGFMCPDTLVLRIEEIR